MERPWPPRSHHLPAVFESGNEVVGLLKRVKFEPSKYFEDRLSTTVFEVGHCFDFDASFYFGNHLLNSEDKKVEDVVVMLNGLNEINNAHFSHYDRFGAAFAARGLGAVLLPTPFHLNRVPYLTEEHKEQYLSRPSPQQKWPSSVGTPQMKRRPTFSLNRDPLSLMHCFDQVSEELRVMAGRLRTSSHSGLISDRQSQLDSVFYDHFYTPDTRVSLMGYSMGGLQALYTFLRFPGVFRRCILINSGINLHNLNPKPLQMSDDQWKTMAATAESRFDRYTKAVERTSPTEPRSEERKRRASHHRLLREILFGMTDLGKIGSLLGNRGSDVLFISGGEDSVANPSLLGEWTKAGVTRIEIGGLAHPLESPTWDRYFPTMVGNIDEFIREPREGTGNFAATQVLDQLAQIHIDGQRWDLALTNPEDQVARHLNRADNNLEPDVMHEFDEDDHARFLQLLLMSKRYYKSDGEMMRALNRQEQVKEAERDRFNAIDLREKRARPPSRPTRTRTAISPSKAD